MTAAVYDTGALLAAERDDRRMWALHKRALQRGEPPTVTAPVVVEGWRGGASMGRLLQGCRVEELDGPGARAAGLLLGRCSQPVEATDAVVVQAALSRQAVVVTSNRRDLEALADGAGRRLAVIDV
jgi:hypothetical protein